MPEFLLEILKALSGISLLADFVGYLPHGSVAVLADTRVTACVDLLPVLDACCGLKHTLYGQAGKRTCLVAGKESVIDM